MARRAARAQGCVATARVRASSLAASRRCKSADRSRWRGRRRLGRVCSVLADLPFPNKVRLHFLSRHRRRLQFRQWYGKPSTFRRCGGREPRGYPCRSVTANKAMGNATAESAVASFSVATAKATGRAKRTIRDAAARGNRLGDDL